MHIYSNDSRTVRESYDSAETDNFPLRVVPDWDLQVARAEVACRLVEPRLASEGEGRLLSYLDDFRPAHLGAEQRVRMVTDLYAAGAREEEW